MLDRMGGFAHGRYINANCGEMQEMQLHNVLQNINGYRHGRVQVSALQKYRESQSGSAKKQLPAFLSQNNADILETIGRKIHIVIAPSNGVRCQ